jgi:hypothetical protein
MSHHHRHARSNLAIILLSVGLIAVAGGLLHDHRVYHRPQPQIIAADTNPISHEQNNKGNISGPDVGGSIDAPVSLPQEDQNAGQPDSEARGDDAAIVRDSADPKPDRRSHFGVGHRHRHHPSPRIDQDVPDFPSWMKMPTFN